MGGAYDWYYIVLDSFGEGYYVEETGEVELGLMIVLVHVELAWDDGRELTDEASSARETVCCARVMVAIGAIFFGGTQWFRREGKIVKERLKYLYVYV